MSPLVSILMPVFNTNEIFLKEAINSLISQTYKNIEIIIIDDCSTLVNVESLVRSYNDSRIRFYRNKNNLGIPKTRNMLIDNANGKYIAFLDSDDVAFHDRIDMQVKFLEKYINIGVLGSDYIQIPKNKIKKVITNQEELCNYTIFRGCCFCNSTTMIRNSVVKDNEVRFNEEYALAEDYGFWAELIKYTNFTNINKALVYLRVHQDSITKAKKDIMKLNTAKIITKQWLDISGNNFANKDIIIRFILGKSLSIVEWNELESFLIKLIDEVKKKFSFYQQSNFYIARHLKKYIIKSNDQKIVTHIFNSKILAILKMKTIIKALIAFKLFCLILKKTFKNN